MRGFTLIELLVYIGLYALLMSGAVSSIAIMNELLSRVSVQAEVLQEGLPMLETLERYAAAGDDMTMFSVSEGTLMQHRDDIEVPISSPNVQVRNLSIGSSSISFTLAAHTSYGIFYSHAFIACLNRTCL